MSELCIVAIGYNRIDSLHRLLESIERADYGEDKCTLIISLDNSGDKKLFQMANNFCWTHGEKRVVLQETRLGLKKHILKCGDYLNEFTAGAILEDDIIVSPAFYGYMKYAVSFYKDNSNIAGISLYTHLRNVDAKYPFEPQKSIYDTYFIQYAQSWGQIWITERWMEFKEWLKDNDESFHVAPKVPQNVCEWSERSWLKYHIRYCIEQNKYFVYPYDAFSTCFSEVGEHCWLKQNVFQVPMLLDSGKQYRFAPFEDKNKAVFYDAYFERETFQLPKFGLQGDMVIDLYGKKNISDYKERYFLSSKRLDYKIIRYFGREMHPIEMNILFSIEGKDFYLYDTQSPEKNLLGSNAVDEYIYFHKILGHTKVIFKLLIEKAKEKIALLYYSTRKK